MIPSDIIDSARRQNGKRARQPSQRPAPNARPAAADSPHETDRGNATRLVERHGADLRHVHPWKRWLCYDGTRWGADTTGEAIRRAKDTIAALYRDAAAEIEHIAHEVQLAADGPSKLQLTAKLKEAQRLLTWALKSEQAPRLDALLNLARSDLPIVPADLDSDVMLFNVVNGTIDLRTGRLRPHRRDDWLTKLCPTPFDRAATCPRWERTLDTIFDGDTELVEYLQRYLGYALTGDVREQTLPVWWGAGANGKSTIINAILETVGLDYGGMVPAELLMENRGEQHPTILADLFGKRLMVAAETSQGRRLNEARLKTLTGGDRIKARRMREDPWEFTPTHKLLLVTNHKPEVRGTDHALWRRLRLVPFVVRFLDAAAPENANRTIPDHLRIDRDLPFALRAERPGILAWLVRGCLDWQRYGLPCPTAVRGATEEYRTAEDVVGTFIAEHCVTGGADFRIRAGALYAAFVKAAEEARERPLTQKRFGEALTERGIERFQSGGWWYRGIALRAEE